MQAATFLVLPSENGHVEDASAHCSRQNNQARVQWNGIDRNEQEPSRIRATKQNWPFPGFSPSASIDYLNTMICDSNSITSRSLPSIAGGACSSSTRSWHARVCVLAARAREIVYQFVSDGKERKQANVGPPKLRAKQSKKVIEHLVASQGLCL